MQDDPSKQVDPEHPVMRMLGAFFDTAIECGLSKAEAVEVAQTTLDECNPDGPIIEPMTAAFARVLEAKGLCDAATYLQLVGSRTGPLLRESRAALGMDERGE